MATVNRIAIGNTTYNVNGAPVVSNLLMSTQTQQYNGNVGYSPFVCELTTSEFYRDPVILSISGVEFVRQGTSLWTEMFLESRYFNSRASTTTTYMGMQERRTSPANTSGYYSLNLVDNLAVGQADVGSRWRPVAYSGQPYKINRMRTTLLIFGTSLDTYGLQSSVLTWTVN